MKKKLYDVNELKEYGETWFNWAKDEREVDLTYYGNWQKDFGKLIIELAELEGSIETILDVGCATALNLRAIDELGVFGKLYGTDISEYMINMIPSLHDFGSYAEFYTTPAWDQPMISDNSIDFILCTHVLEHIPDEDLLDKTLKEFKRILYKDGKIIIIMPIKTSPDEEKTHSIIKNSIWWSKTFSKHFKSETTNARKKFKATKLKPNRKHKNTFYDEYDEVWKIYRLIQK